jgi:lipoate-protein ligase A
MQLPRHVTSRTLPGERPREALVQDEALLGSVQPELRLWIASAPAVVVGLGLRHRLAQVVDLERCRAAGVEVLERNAGGGAVLVDDGILCGAVSVPHPVTSNDDVTESYRWLSDLLVERLCELGLHQARRVDVAEARADVAALRSRTTDPLARLILGTCYGALSPHEVAIGEAKLVGLAQIRRRQASLFQFGILLRDQAELAEYLVVPDSDEGMRQRLRAELGRRTVGVQQILTDRAASEVAAAVAGATPFAP